MAIINLIQLLIELPTLIALALHFGKDHRTGKRTVTAFLIHTTVLAGLIGFTVALLNNLDKVDSLIWLGTVGIAIFALVMAVWIVGIIVGRRVQL